MSHTLPRIRVGAIVAALLLAAAALGDSAVASDPQSNPAKPYDTSRIVSIGGAITEILYGLGLARQVIAVDSTSTFPPQALREKANVGYMRQLSPEGVLGLNPSLILMTEGSGPKETIAVLEAATVPLVMVPDRFAGDGILDKIRIVARAVDARERGECLAKAVEADLSELAHLRGRIERPRRAAFLLSFLGSRAQVAGRNTAADGILRLAGAVNVLTDFDGYKPINDEAVIAARPDFVLAMQRDAFPLDARTVFAHPAFALTTAARTQAFAAMNGQYLLGFGPRTARAARDLAATLHPQLRNEQLPSEQGLALEEACRR